MGRARPWTVVATGADVDVVVLQLEARRVVVGLTPGEELPFQSS